MQPDDILACLPDDHGFTRLSVTISAKETTHQKDIEDLVRTWAGKGASGWIARQSGVVFPPGADNPALGAVLEAELGTRDASLQIRRIGAGWVWTTFEETAAGAGVCDDVVLVTAPLEKADAAGPRASRYRRYWRLPDNGAAEIFACRLVGLEEIA
ncbi:hypothetical protein [Stappia sp.]|uniref:hypothetical protein n=1 Tax=Stappia sp. TaxID=1870903 RepID=UPI003D0C896F